MLAPMSGHLGATVRTVCRQGVVGSSPIVSIRKAQVTRFLFGRDLRRIARRAHYVLPNGGRWCVVVVREGTGGSSPKRSR